MSVRTAFVERFGESDAAAIEAAARQHHPDDSDLGSDPFKWALLIAIGFECMTRFADDHGIKADPAELQSWCVTNGGLGDHDGRDLDYISMADGVYGDWIAP